MVHDDTSDLLSGITRERTTTSAGLQAIDKCVTIVENSSKQDSHIPTAAEAVHAIVSARNGVDQIYATYETLSRIRTMLRQMARKQWPISAMEAIERALHSVLDNYQPRMARVGVAIGAVRKAIDVTEPELLAEVGQAAEKLTSIMAGFVGVKELLEGVTSYRETYNTNTVNKRKLVALTDKTTHYRKNFL